MRIAVLGALVVALLVVAGCGGSGPAADEGKSKEQIRTEASQADRPTLEKIIADYIKVIREKTAEKTKLLQEKGTEALGDAMSALEKELGNLEERLRIYEAELEKKK